MPDLDLVIIGAGAAGIAASRAAINAGLTHQVIEASHRTGGRAYTEDLAPGVPFDLGCHWLHTSDINPLVPEADRLGFFIDRGFAFSAHLWLNGRHGTAAESSAYASYFDWAESGAGIALDPREDRDVLSLLDTSSPYFAPYAHVFSVIHAADPDQVSARDVMAQVANGGDWPVRDGLGRLLARLGADIPVSLNTIAEEIDWSQRDRVLVHTDRGSVTARAVLVTVSIGILQSGLIKFRPSLPAPTLSAIDGFSPGVANRVALYFDRDVFGDAPNNFTIIDGDAEPLAIYIPPFGFNYVVGQTGGRYASHLTRAGQKVATAYVLDRIAAVFGEGIRRHFVRSIVSAWGDRSIGIGRLCLGQTRPFRRPRGTGKACRKQAVLRRRGGRHADGRDLWRRLSERG
ncbi:flavin monoamine oxidase family protein [Dongia deserti]|uniref:flavin monoamine oxidase family protein n=1 Tax=Dongia deserti TaxID=2268030 RepID=UPI000E650920|nr:FAD-dependent oxidoreductase [Dongia deserti]